MDRNKLIELVKKELNREPEILTPREKAILSLRFGFTDSMTHSLEETGKVFGITRERVRQIEEKVFSKIRKQNKRSESDNKPNK